MMKRMKIDAVHKRLLDQIMEMEADRNDRNACAINAIQGLLAEYAAICKRVFTCRAGTRKQLSNMIREQAPKCTFGELSKERP